jgi:hypothetical protein
MMENAARAPPELAFCFLPRRMRVVEEVGVLADGNGKLVADPGRPAPPAV